MKILIFLCFAACFIPQFVLAQLGIGGIPHPSAAIDIPSTTKAAYLPRMTTAQRQAIVNPQQGALVFDLDRATLFLYDGQNWLPLATTTINKLAPIDRTASDGSKEDMFGASVCLSGDYAIVGAPEDTVGTNHRQGSAYIFVRSGHNWVEQAKLTAPDGAFLDGFGGSVSISGDYAIIGASYDDIGPNNDQGSAYIFMRSGNDWLFKQKLVAADGGVSDLFGTSVSLLGDYALIGVFNSRIGDKVNQGAAYVFRRVGDKWIFQTKLTANDGQANDKFGRSVALAGNYAIVGVHYSNENGEATYKGAAYIFVRSDTTWVQQAKLTARDGEAYDYFGCSVAISGAFAIVGAYGDDIDGKTDQGSAYLFARIDNSWAFLYKLVATDGDNSHNFGTSVSMSDNWAIVGSPSDNIGVYHQQGSAYLYRRDGNSWYINRKIVEDTAENTYNGAAVFLTNGTFLIGGYGFKGKGKVAFGTID